MKRPSVSLQEATPFEPRRRRFSAQSARARELLVSLGVAALRVALYFVLLSGLVVRERLAPAPGLRRR